jgi:heme-degrading monooxygenase HmoA
MFIAMNRFRVAKGSEAAFENVWMSRDSHLEKVPGFVEFHLLKGPEAEDHTLYASHTVWENRAVFEAWTKSEAFWERITARNDRSWRKADLQPPAYTLTNSESVSQRSFIVQVDLPEEEDSQGDPRILIWVKSPVCLALMRLDEMFDAEHVS